MKKMLGNRILMHNNILASLNNLPSIPLLQLVRGFAKPVEKPAKVGDYYYLPYNLIICF